MKTTEDFLAGFGIDLNDSLAHHGIKGQKWGVRRFQNEDGSLTPEGRERYGYGKSTRDANTIMDQFRKSATPNNIPKFEKKLGKVVDESGVMKGKLGSNISSLLDQLSKISNVFDLSDSDFESYSLAVAEYTSTIEDAMRQLGIGDEDVKNAAWLYDGYLFSTNSKRKKADIQMYD